MSKGPSILVVDDDRGLARLIEKILRREGIAAWIALSGEEAIKWNSGHKPDLILIDLKLPDLQAAELLEMLGEEGKVPPFIVITGEGDERTAVDMMKRGALDYLVKDTRFLELLPIVVRRTLAHLASCKHLALTETRLRKEHAFSSAVLETSGALVLVVDATGKVVRINRACENLSGYIFEEVHGKPFWQLFLSAHEQESARQGLRELITLPAPQRREAYLLTKEGGRRLVSWSLTTLLSEEEGAVEFIVASGMDITDYRQLERDILEVSENEQKRIGQDLHDGICQLLAGIDMMATVLQRKLADTSPAESIAASDISRYTRQAIDQARMLARGLSPVELEANGLTSALQELTAMSAKIFDVECTFSCTHLAFLDDNARATHLYRIVQESISNAIKHGRAKAVAVTLASDGVNGMLTIRDDGSGFRTESDTHCGMGLRSMRYRANLIGGRLGIKESESDGTTVTCVFPLTPQGLNLWKPVHP